MNRKCFLGLLILLSGIMLSACFPAIPGLPRNTRDSFFGIWVVIIPESEQKGEVDPNGFNDPDALLLWQIEETQNGEIYLSIGSQGNIRGRFEGTSASDEEEKNTIRGTVYVTSQQPVIMKLYGIYQKPDGIKYTTPLSVWLSVDEGGSLSVSEERPVRNGKKQILEYTVDIETLDPLQSVELVYFDAGDRVLSRKTLDLSALRAEDQQETVPSQCAYMMVREIRSGEEGESVIRTLYHPDDRDNWEDDNMVLHPLVLEGDNMTGRLAQLELRWP